MPSVERKVYVIFEPSLTKGQPCHCDHPGRQGPVPDLADRLSANGTRNPEPKPCNYTIPRREGRHSSHDNLFFSLVTFHPERWKKSQLEEMTEVNVE